MNSSYLHSEPHTYVFGEFYLSLYRKDLRVLTTSGELIARLEPSEITEGVRDYAVSLYQELLFCLMEG